MSFLNDVSSAALHQASAIKEKIEALQHELGRVLGSTTISISVSTLPAGKKKGGMSAAGKKKIAAAQKKRWAKFRADKTSGKTDKPKAKLGRPSKKNGV